MRIACLQLAPELGKVQENIERAETILNDADLEGIDLLILPELAFTGTDHQAVKVLYIGII